MTEDTYLPNADYASLIAALLNPPVCPFTGKATDDQIKIVLGDHAGRWCEENARIALLGFPSVPMRFCNSFGTAILTPCRATGVVRARERC